MTRWIENVDGYERFLSTIAYIVEVLEIIAHKFTWKYTQIGESRILHHKNVQLYVQIFW